VSAERADGPVTPRYRIVAGGLPSPEELAALTIALTPVAVRADDGRSAGPSEGWLRAALHEGVADVRITSARQAADLR
jgi:hypothetical protein